MLVRKQVQAEKERLKDPRDPEEMAFPTKPIQVLTAGATIDKLQAELDDQREQTAMRLVNEMT